MRRVYTFLVLLIMFSNAFAKVEFKPEKKEYKKGEKVCFYIENKSPKDVFLPSSAPWAVFDGEKVIYSPVATQQIIKLRPSEKKKWCWKQKTFKEDEIITSGDYKIRLSIFEEGKIKFLSFSIKIVSDFSDAK